MLFPSNLARLALLVLVGVAGSSPVAGKGPPMQSDNGAELGFSAMVADLAAADVVLIGERHDDRAHHRVQQTVIQALAGQRAVALGLEAFPAGEDQALADWRRGRIGDWPTFLDEADWYRHWGVAPEAYRPVLETARLLGLPTAGINIPRAWIRTVAAEGPEALTDEQRERIGPVAPVPEGYRERLEASFESHDGGRSVDSFIAAQLRCDAAMAGGLLELHRQHPEHLIIGLAGSGHIRGGYGIPRQLRERASDVDVATVLPFDPDRDDPPAKGEADYLWPVAPDRLAEPVRIGVALGEGEGEAPVVKRVLEGHPAAQAGVQAGDRIRAVDGQSVANATALIHAIRQHDWGGCLRLRIAREGEEEELSVRLDRPEAEKRASGH